MVKASESYVKLVKRINRFPLGAPSMAGFFEF